MTFTLEDLAQQISEKNKPEFFDITVEQLLDLSKDVRFINFFDGANVPKPRTVIPKYKRKSKGVADGLSMYVEYIYKNKDEICAQENPVVGMCLGTYLKLVPNTFIN